MKIKDLLMEIGEVLVKHSHKLDWGFLILIGVFFLPFDVYQGRPLMTVFDLLLLGLIGSSLYQHYKGEESDSTKPQA